MRILTGLALVCLAGLPSQAQEPTGPRVVSARWLAQRLNDPSIVVLHVGHGDFAKGHIPGARELPYGELIVERDGLRSELPDADLLRARFERLGIGDSTVVVAYAHEGPMAMRALFSLAALGHERIAYLDGGLPAWRADGGAVARGPARAPRIAAGRLTHAGTPQVLVTADWLESRMTQPGLALLDTRTTGEYIGRGNRSGMPSAGHLAGARQLEWEDLFADRSLRLKSRADLEALYRERVAGASEVVTYCWVGYRASATWFVARVLGYDAKMYDGSYQDWQRRALPVRAGSDP